jgi:hypothetical protein
MTLVLAGMVGDAVVMCADRRVRVVSPDRPDEILDRDKLVVVRTIAVAMYCAGPPRVDVPASIQGIIASCADAHDAASAIRKNFRALSPNMFAFVGSCDASGPQLFQVDVAHDVNARLALAFGEGHHIWSGPPSKIPAKLRNASQVTPEEMLDHMLKIERAVMQSASPVGAPFDTAILRSSAAPVLRRVAA